MTQAHIRIPTPLRKFTGGADEVTVSGSTVGELQRRPRETTHAGRDKATIRYAAEPTRRFFSASICTNP